MRSLILAAGILAAAAAVAGAMSARRRRPHANSVAQHAPRGYRPSEWGAVEEASDQSFPASDPPGRY